MFAKGVPKRFWADGVITACYLINRIPAQGLGDKSPYEVLNGQKPSLNHLRVFGCKCHVFIPEGQRDKLEPRSLKCMFIGYSTTQKGYKCFHPETSRTYVSREVKFDEEHGFFEEKKWRDLDEITQQGREDVELMWSVPVQTVTHEYDANAPIRSSNEDISLSMEGSCEENDYTNTRMQGGILSQNEETSMETQEEVEDNQEDNELVEEPVIPTQPLRRSQRQRFGPDNWKNTRVYYNGLAKDNQPEDKKQGILSTVVGKCSGCTTGPSALSIGNSVSQLQSRERNQSAEALTKIAIKYPIQAYYSTTKLSIEDQAYLKKLDKEHIPKTYEEAFRSQVWNQAMKEEIESMERNHTWDMIELPKGKKAVGCRWVYTIKYKSNGEVERYKARLVAKGYTQKYGEDYSETFAPVAKLYSVRALLSVAINLSWELWQMDVKNAFLQGDLQEEVYMMSPQGYSQNANQVCKLRKAIYGLKQSPRAWYQRLSGCLEREKFVKSEADHTLFTKKEEKGLVAILVYVDDIIITGDNVDGIQKTKEILKREFDIKDLGKLKYFLGIEMMRSEEGMFISQRKYVIDLLTETGKLGARPANTPIEEGYQKESNEELWLDEKQYQRIVGKLIYLTITRPDISFAVSRVSQHMQAPTTHNWSMVERILRYLKGCPGKGIWLQCNGHTKLMGFCDADWAGDKKDRKSTSGYCTFIGGNLVTWRSKKQKVIALSSAEAEYRAMKEVTKELVWLKGLLRDIGIQDQKPITLCCDNQATIHIATNPVFHERTKHIEVDCHYVRGKIQEGVISTKFVKSGDQVADIFTKATTSIICNYIHSKIGLLDPYRPVLRGSVEKDDFMEVETRNDSEEQGKVKMGQIVEISRSTQGMCVL